MNHPLYVLKLKINLVHFSKINLFFKKEIFKKNHKIFIFRNIHH